MKRLPKSYYAPSRCVVAVVCKCFWIATFVAHPLHKNTCGRAEQGSNSDREKRIHRKQLNGIAIFVWHLVGVSGWMGSTMLNITGYNIVYNKMSNNIAAYRHEQLNILPHQNVYQQHKHKYVIFIKGIIIQYKLKPIWRDGILLRILPFSVLLLVLACAGLWADRA